MTKLPLTPTLTGSTHPNQPDPPPVRPPPISHPQAGADAQPPPVRRLVRARGRRAASTRPPAVPHRPSSTASGRHREPRRACAMTGEGSPPLEAEAGGLPCRRERRRALVQAAATCAASGGGRRRELRCEARLRELLCAWRMPPPPRAALRVEEAAGNRRGCSERGRGWPAHGFVGVCRGCVSPSTLSPASPAAVVICNASN